MKKATILLICVNLLLSGISALINAFVENTLAKDIIMLICSILVIATDIALCVIFVKYMNRDKGEENTTAFKPKLLWILGGVVFALGVIAAVIVVLVV